MAPHHPPAERLAEPRVDALAWPSVWLRWTLIGSAGLGTLNAGSVLLEHYQAQAHDVRQEGMPLLVMGTILFFLFLAWLQQLILCSAGLQARFWTVTTAVGLVIGGVLGTVAGQIAFNVAAWFDFSLFPCLNISVCSGAFIWGTVLGAIQFSGVGGSRQHVFWIASSGLAMLSMAVCLVFLSNRWHNPNSILAVTLCGGCYGLVSGGGVVCLLWRNEQRRRRELLRGSE